MTDVSKLSAGTVKEAQKALSGLSDAELKELHDLEEAKKDPRSTLLDAIHVEQDKRKADDEKLADEPVDDRAARFATMTATFG